MFAGRDAGAETGRLMYRAFQAVAIFLMGYRLAGGHWIVAVFLFALLALAAAAAT